MLLMLIGILACNEEFSETVEIGSLNPGALANEAGVNFALTAAYSAIDGVSGVSGGWTATGDNWWMDAISDDAHKGSTDGDQQDLFLLETHSWTTGNGYLFSKWRALYAGANRANAVIDLIGKIDGDFSSQLAEARFLRGHYYFELQKMYGYIAYISEVEFASLEFNQPNTGDVWAQIEADFEAAKAGLPATQGEPGRATKHAAAAYLGKAHLFQGDWANALSELNSVISSGRYALLGEYGHNFRLAGENGSESVFAIQFDVAGGAFAPNGNGGGTLNFGGPNGWCCGFYQPTQDLVNAFQTSSGLPLIGTYNQSDVTNDQEIASDAAFTPHAGTLDPRLDFTVGRRGIMYNGWDIHPGQAWVRAGDGDISGPYTPKKNVYHAGETANMGAGNWGQQSSGINYHFIRYADVLLMAAEAAVETNDLTTALNYVNQVRARAKSSTPVSNDGGATPAANYDIELYTAADFGSQGAARDRVRMERRLELAMEGHRLFDIRRWSEGVQIMNDYFANEARTIPNFAGKANAMQDKHRLFPIPIGAIDVSAGALTQNPNW